MPTRREFLQLASATAVPMSATGAANIAPADQRLRLLFLGGTGFIGPHQVRHALARGHEVTIFNRSGSGDLFDGRVEELLGNRDARIDAGLSALAGARTWDVVVDNSGYVPRHVRDSAELLKGRVGRYLYVSTVAVYDFAAANDFPEAGPLAPLPDKSIEEVTNETYGPLKAECDRIVRDIYGDSCTVVRPTYIVGPGDTTDRFTYWVQRIFRGGDILAPGNPQHEIQWVDVRDMCPWLIGLAERDMPGIFNSCGPVAPISREGLMWGLAATTGAPVRFHWPDAALVDDMGIPMPMLATEETSVHFRNEASIAAGHPYRPLADSARGTLDWWRSQTEERRANARRWPSAEQERDAIARIAGA